MHATRLNAILVGILFISGTAAGVIVASMTNPIMNAPDYLAKMATNEGQIIVASFLYFLMAISCAGIGLALYPILKTYSEGLAMGAAGFRIIEGVIQVIGSASMVCLLALSQELLQAGTADPTHFQTIGAIIKTGSDWLGNGPMLLSWGMAALMYYAIFFRFKLVPRWLSGWGLAGISLTILASVAVMLKLFPSFGTVQTAANLPIAIQEMVFAIWLIAKGINPATITHLSTTPRYSLRRSES